MAITNGAGAGPSAGSIQFDPDGFPIVPCLAWDKTTKDDLETLYHSYMTQHYCECQLPTAILLFIFSDRTCLPR
jgi:hypothetical protein